MSQVPLSLICVPLLAGCEEEFPLTEPRAAPGSVTVLDTVGPDGQTGWWPSLAFDTTDRPHLSYCDAYHANLRYATRDGTQWRVSSVVSEGKVAALQAHTLERAGADRTHACEQDQRGGPRRSTSGCVALTPTAGGASS